MKRFSIVLALTVALSLVFVGSAFANFGPHGGYINDTDACAGCHRAHTSFSTVGWTDRSGAQHASALLVGNANTMTEFCDACHGDAAPGASTNVASGVFDSGPSAGNNLSGTSVTGVVLGNAPSTFSTTSTANPAAPGSNNIDTATYQAGAAQVLTASTFGAPLNGGGFNRMPDPYAWQGGGNTTDTVVFVKTTSEHEMDVTGPLWGAGNTVGNYANGAKLTCTDCHDPHGSSNYRLLKAKPNPGGPVVGGYAADNQTPTPFVYSNEQGYPVPTSVANPGGGVTNGLYPAGGWLKGQAGADQINNYRPNYTDTTGTVILHTDTQSAGATKSMSVWCSACHTNYNQSSAGNPVTYNYGTFLPLTSAGGPTAGMGALSFHRHAIDVTMANGTGTGRTLAEQVVQDSAWVPLENPGSGDPSDWTNGYIGCLTCHRAHGTSTTMDGWAASHLEAGPSGSYIPVKDSLMGVDPDKGNYNNTTGQGSSALLRANDRGVCERCHNK